MRSPGGPIAYRRSKATTKLERLDSPPPVSGRQLETGGANFVVGIMFASESIAWLTALTRAREVGQLRLSCRVFILTRDAGSTKARHRPRLPSSKLSFAKSSTAGSPLREKPIAPQCPSVVAREPAIRMALSECEPLSGRRQRCCPRHYQPS
jgi:hypothetical protein